MGGAGSRIRRPQGQVDGLAEGAEHLAVLGDSSDSCFIWSLQWRHALISLLQLCAAVTSLAIFIMANVNRPAPLTHD